MSHNLTQCPVCRYNLTGLPAAHRCPECGFAYDAHTWIWRPLKPRAVFGGLAAFLGGPGGIINLMLKSGTYRPALQALCYLGMLTWASGAIYVGHRCYRLYKEGQFVSVGPDGIRFRLKSPLVQFLRWDAIETVLPQRFDRVCCVVRKHGETEVQLSGCFRSSQEVLLFYDRVLGRLEDFRRSGQAVAPAELT